MASEDESFNRERSLQPIPVRLAKGALHGALRAVGFRVYRTGSGALGWATRRSALLGRVLGHPHAFVPDESDRYRWLESLNLGTVIDIGAHHGEFARRIREILPGAEIISFEPLPDCYEKLRALELPRHRHFNLAIGDSKKKTTMHQNDFTPASSLLATNSGMEREMPFATNSRAVEIEVDTLDSVCRGLELAPNVMVKIDVQGFECQVIEGGIGTLERAKLVIVETSFRRIYDGQPLFGAVYDALVDRLGFRYCGSWDRQPSPIDGHPLQEDSIFLRD